MSDTQVLWSYPFVFHRVRRVDAKYAYLVVKDGFVPLRRREGVLWKYVKYGEWRSSYDPTAPSEYFEKVVLSDYDEVSTFFQTQMLKEEYAEEIEKDDYGKLWDKKLDELYGMRKHVKEFVQKRREEKRRIKHKQGFFCHDTFDHLLYPVDKECKDSKYVDPCSVDDENPRRDIVKLQTIEEWMDDKMSRETKKRKVRYLFF